jgi:chromosome segregation ATPase
VSGSDRDLDRFDRVLETMAQTHVELTSAVVRIEAIVERETTVMERVLDKVDKLEQRLDQLEQRAAKMDGWRAGAIAATGGGAAFGLQWLLDIFGKN